MFLILAILIVLKLHLKVVLICISLMTKNVKQFLKYLHPFEFILLRIVYLNLYHIFNWIIWFLMSSFLSSLYILETSPLSDMELVRSFPILKINSIYCWSQCLCYWCSIQEVVSCAKSFKTTSYFLFYQCITGFMSLIHLDLSFVQGNRYNLFAFFYMLIPRYASTICWRCFLFSIV